MIPPPAPSMVSSELQHFCRGLVFQVWSLLGFVIMFVAENCQIAVHPDGWFVVEGA
jgi:hypothetical protein